MAVDPHGPGGGRRHQGDYGAGVQRPDTSPAPPSFGYGNQGAAERTPSPQADGTFSAQQWAGHNAGQAATRSRGSSMTTIAMACVVMLVVAAATYFFLLPGPIVVLAALLVAFVLAGVVIFGRATVPLRIAYGAVNGILVGGALWVSWGFGLTPVQLVGLGILTLLAVAGLFLPGGSKRQ